jgi:hypothetical protein
MTSRPINTLTSMSNVRLAGWKFALQLFIAGANGNRPVYDLACLESHETPIGSAQSIGGSTSSTRTETGGGRFKTGAMLTGPTPTPLLGGA